MNTQWHEQHKLKSDATPMQQISWHEAHQKHCGCSPIPDAIKRQIPPNNSADQT